jgi:hypothetical protein
MYKRLSQAKKQQINEAWWATTLTWSQIVQTQYDQGSILSSIPYDVFMTSIWPKLWCQYLLNNDLLDVIQDWRFVSKS